MSTAKREIERQLEENAAQDRLTPEEKAWNFGRETVWAHKLSMAVDSHSVPALLEALNPDSVSHLCEYLATVGLADPIRDLVTMVIMQERLACASIARKADSLADARAAILARTGSEQDVHVNRMRV